jgi:hypothetical protein
VTPKLLIISNYQSLLLNDNRGERNLMGHQVNYYNGVLTVRIDGRVHTQEILQDIRQNLDQLEKRAAVILDTTLCSGFDQLFKSMLYRILQHQYVGVVGIFGVNAAIEQDMRDIVTVLSRVRRVVVRDTEAELMTEFGLAEPEHKLSGMLAYLKKD